MTSEGAKDMSGATYKTSLPRVELSVHSGAVVSKKWQLHRLHKTVRVGEKTSSEDRVNVFKNVFNLE